MSGEDSERVSRRSDPSSWNAGMSLGVSESFAAKISFDPLSQLLQSWVFLCTDPGFRLILFRSLIYLLARPFTV